MKFIRGPAPTALIVLAGGVIAVLYPFVTPDSVVNFEFFGGVIGGVVSAFGVMVDMPRADPKTSASGLFQMRTAWALAAFLAAPLVAPMYLWRRNSWADPERFR